MSRVKVTNVKVYKKVPEYTLTETPRGVREKQSTTQALQFNFNGSDFMDKSQLELYRKRFKREDPLLTVLLTYEEFS
jgi:hypothetical protein